MRKSDLQKNHEPFDAAVTRYRNFMQKIISAKHTVNSAQEKRDVVESVLLRLCAIDLRINNGTVELFLLYYGA